MKSYGIDPGASFEMKMDDECCKTLTCSHGRGGAGVFRWCKPVAGTLAFRDGFKTGPSTPNGQDAYDGKLVVW